MSCPATETQYGTVTVTELTTSVVRTVVESPGAVRTNFVTGCATIVSGTCVGTTTSLVVTTEPPTTSTVESTITNTVVRTSARPTRTLFGPCSPGQEPRPDTPASFTSIYTPPPILETTMSSMTLSGGSVVVVTTVVTNTQDPTPVLIPQSTTGAGSPTGGKKTAIAPIIGGVAGGFVGLVLIIGLVYYCLKKRPSWDDIFDKDVNAPVRPPRDSNRVDLTDVEPKPYPYGLVGTTSPPLSPPNSPPSPPMDPNVGHYRQGSTAQLMVPGTMVYHQHPQQLPIQQPHTDLSSRPSSSASVQPFPNEKFYNANGGMGARPLSSHSMSSVGSGGPHQHERSMSGTMSFGAFNPYVDPAMSAGSGSSSNPNDDMQWRPLQVANPEPVPGSPTSTTGSPRASTDVKLMGPQPSFRSVVVHSDMMAGQASAGAGPSMSSEQPNIYSHATHAAVPVPVVTPAPVRPATPVTQTSPAPMPPHLPHDLHGGAPPPAYSES